MSHFRPGPLTGPDAARLNEMLRRLEQLDRASASAPVSTSRAGGIPQFTVPADKPVILAEITADDGGTPPVHEAKRKTRAAEAYSTFVVNDAVDFSPEALYDKVLSPDGSVIATGTLVALAPVPDHPGYFWALPSAVAGAGTDHVYRKVRAASTATGTLSTDYENGDTLDGVTLATGDRILLKNQSTGSQNGIYTVNASGAPTRATDADAVDDLVCATVAVSEGTTNADTIWICTTNATWTPGVTASVWAKVYPPATGTGTPTYVGYYDETGETANEVDYLGADVATFAGAEQTPYDNAVEFPDNQPLIFWEIPSDPGRYWIVPGGPASASFYGYVTAGTQAFAGDKEFTDFVQVNTDNSHGNALVVEDGLGGALAVYSEAYTDWTDRYVAYFSSGNRGRLRIQGGVAFEDAVTRATAPDNTVFRCSDYPGVESPTDLIVHKNAGGTSRRLCAEVSGTFTVKDESDVVWTMVVEDGHIAAMSPPP